MHFGIRSLTSVAIPLLFAGGVEAQQLEPRPTPTGPVESFTFRSPSMNVRFAVNVGRPAGFKPGAGKRYEALIVTDGDWAFPGVAVAAENLAGVIESPFLISIGTAVDEGEDVHVARRVYEFSPPNWGLEGPFGTEVSQGCIELKVEPGRCTGGAPKFLNAIVTELIPLVAAKYPIDPARLGLFGISAGGFFASWVIFQPNSPFTKYLISSPAMVYGNGEIFRQEARYAEGHTDLPVAIYLAAGTLEASDPYFEGVGTIVSGMTHFAGVLAGRHYPGLKLITEFHPGMSHVDAMGASVVRGLRVLYPK